MLWVLKLGWINHLPPACWSTSWKSIFKHQLGCRFDKLDSISSFFCIVTYAIIYVLIHHIIFLLYLYFLNIFNFFKYSCINIFHRRSLCTFYMAKSPLGSTNHNNSRKPILTRSRPRRKIACHYAHHYIIIWRGFFSIVHLAVIIKKVFL